MDDRDAVRSVQGTTHLDELSRIYEGTLGGPIVRDKLWFFTSARYGKTSNQLTLARTGLGLTQVATDKRGEIKLTASPLPGHTIQGGYLTNPLDTTNFSGAQRLVIDPHSETSQSIPNWYCFTNYKGVVRSNVLVEAQYSERRYKILEAAPSGANLVTDSPFLCLDGSCLYNAPYFDNQKDPEQRNNRQFTASATNYLTLHGRHEVKGGYECFRSQRTGGGSQSPTQYVFNANFLTGAGGAPVLDATSRPIPVFQTGQTGISYYPAIVGAVMNVDSNSLYVQDHWTVSDRLSADLGARFEHVTVESTGSLTSIKNNRIVPRLAASYDVAGDGNHVIHASYGQYSGRYNENQVGKNSPVGNAPEIDAKYQGPSGQGYDFAPAFDLANYPITSQNASVRDPTKNVFMAPGTKSFEFNSKVFRSRFKG